MTTPTALTAKQQAVYLMVVRYYMTTGEPCSISYLARRLRKHRTTIRGHLQAIIDKGFAARSTPAFRRLQI